MSTIQPDRTTERLRLVATVTGEVQAVGYRYAVRDIANSLGVDGYVRNLPDGSVETVAEGTKEQLEKFIQEIKMDTAPIHVRQIKTRFSRPKGLKGFRIRIGTTAEEIVEGLGTGMKYIALTRDEVKSVGSEVRSVREEVRSVGEEVMTVGHEVKAVKEEVRAVGNEVRTVGRELKSELQAAREDIKSGFQLMDQKYGVISETLKELTQEFKKFTQLIEQYLRR